MAHLLRLALCFVGVRHSTKTSCGAIEVHDVLQTRHMPGPSTTRIGRGRQQDGNLRLLLIMMGVGAPICGSLLLHIVGTRTFAFNANIDYMFLMFCYTLLMSSGQLLLS